MKLVSYDRLPIKCADWYNATEKLLYKDDWKAKKLKRDNGYIIPPRDHITILTLQQSYDGNINDSSKESGQIDIEPKEGKCIFEKIAQKSHKLIRLQVLILRMTKILNFKSFRNLTHLNLANNKLINDFSQNFIISKLTLVCELINNLHNLIGFSICTNPMMKELRMLTM